MVTDGGNKNALAVLRSLGRQKHWLGITSSFPRVVTLTAYSRYCRKVHVLKSDARDIDSYSVELLNVLDNEKYDVLLPVGLNSCLAVSKYQKQFRELTKVVVPDWEKMQIAYNRDRAISFANEVGVPTPRTHVLYTADELKRIDTYPVVIKSSDDSGGLIRYCNDTRELEENFEKLQSKSMTNIIAQEYIKGFGCGFYGVYDNGRLVAHFMHKRIKEFPITGGPSVVAESYFDEGLFNWGRKLCDALDWHGPIMAEFKYDVVQGEYKLIEVNPKLWGSLDLTIESGVDVPAILVKLAIGEEVDKVDHYEYLKYRWIFPGEFKALMSSLSFKNLVEFVRSGGRTKTNLKFSDPLPTMIQVVRGLLEGFGLIFSADRKFVHGRIR